VPLLRSVSGNVDGKIKMDPGLRWDDDIAGCRTAACSHKPDRAHVHRLTSHTSASLTQIRPGMRP